MSLKLKGIIYQFTGLYLATREECEYLKSEEFWDEFEQMMKTSDWSMVDTQGVLIGTWQARHGLYRGMWEHDWRSRTALFKTIGWFVLFFRAAKRHLSARLH